MQADKILFDALSGTGLPVNRVVAKYTNNDEIPSQYFVYSISSGTPAYQDDFLAYIQLNYVISLFSKGDYTDILSQTVGALNTESIRIHSIGGEFYNSDIDFYQIQINVSINEYWEE